MIIEKNTKRVMNYVCSHPRCQIVIFPSNVAWSIDTRGSEIFCSEAHAAQFEEMRRGDYSKLKRLK